VDGDGEAAIGTIMKRDRLGVMEIDPDKVRRKDLG